MITQESAKLRETIRAGLVCKCRQSENEPHSSFCLWNQTVTQIYELERKAEDQFLKIMKE